MTMASFLLSLIVFAYLQHCPCSSINVLSPSDLRVACNASVHYSRLLRFRYRRILARNYVQLLPSWHLILLRLLLGQVSHVAVRINLFLRRLAESCPRGIKLSCMSPVFLCSIVMDALSCLLRQLCSVVFILLAHSHHSLPS